MVRIYVLTALLAFLPLANSLSGPHVCTRAASGIQYYYTSCGAFGWKRCHRSRVAYHRENYCCAGWKTDNQGGCRTPICTSACQNGGTCVSPDTCQCNIYHSGRHCETELAVCIPACEKGGKCIGPNRCQCDIYHYGSRCQLNKSCSNKELELLFLLDSSGSIGQSNFEALKSFTRSIIEQFDIAPNATRVGLITFSRYPVLRLKLNDNKDISDLLETIDNIPYIPGLTETHSALRLLLQEGFIESRYLHVPHVAILITGSKSIHLNDTKAAVDALHRNGILMFVIGVGDRISKEELRLIATNPDEKHLFLVNDYTMVSGLSKNLTTLTCDAPSSSYSPVTTPKPVIIQPARIRDPTDDCAGKVADIVILLDSSTSLGTSGFRSVDHFALNIVNDFDIAFNSTLVGIIEFSAYPAERIALGSTDDKLEILNSINQVLYYSGPRDTDKALEMLRLEGFKNDRKYAPNIVLLITDGPSTNSFLTTRAANELKQTGVEVFAVGVGEHIDRTELEHIASNGENHIVTAPNILEFEMISFEWLVSKAVCQAVPLPTTTTTPTTSSVTTVPTSATSTSQTASSSAGCLPAVKDVIFLVDSSGSVGDANFNHVKEFIKQTIDTFDIGFNKTRVGLIVFNTYATEEFSLDKYYTKQELLNAVENITYTTGGTNTGAALELLRTKGFNNDRPDAPNIAFLITDGYSTDKNATRHQASLAKESNRIQIFAIGIGQLLDSEELADIASSNPSRNRSLIYHVDDFDELHVNSLNRILASVVCSAEITSTVVPTAILSSNCTDEVDNCDEYDQDMCISYRPWATAHCNRFCGFCRGPPKPSGAHCVDTIDNCREYGHNICTSPSFRKWTKQNCASFCELCGVATPTPSTTTTTTVTSLLCIDKVDSCAAYKQDMCTSYRPWAMEHCRRFCGFCQASGSTPLPKPCVDEIDNCNEYGNYICTTPTFALWVQKHCARFCNICGTPPSTTFSSIFQPLSTRDVTTALPVPARFSESTQLPCTDEVDNCDEFESDMCTRYHPWATAHCNKYCGFCQDVHGIPTTPKPCVDKISNCDEYGNDICTTTTFALWVKHNCARFCNVCDSNTLNLSTTPMSTTDQGVTQPLSTRVSSDHTKKSSESPSATNDLSNLTFSGTSPMSTTSRLLYPSPTRGAHNLHTNATESLSTAVTRDAAKPNVTMSIP